MASFERFIGINYLYTGDNGRSALLLDNNQVSYDTEYINNPIYSEWVSDKTAYQSLKRDYNGNPPGNIELIGKTKRIDNLILYGVGTTADLFKNSPIGIIAGGGPALINILNGVGNNDDLIALGISSVALITQITPVGELANLLSGYHLITYNHRFINKIIGINFKSVLCGAIQTSPLKSVLLILVNKLFAGADN